MSEINFEWLKSWLSQNNYTIDPERGYESIKGNTKSTFDAVFRRLQFELKNCPLSGRSVQKQWAASWGANISELAAQTHYIENYSQPRTGPQEPQKI